MTTCYQTLSSCWVTFSAWVKPWLNYPSLALCLIYGICTYSAIFVYIFGKTLIPYLKLLCQNVQYSFVYWIFQAKLTNMANIHKSTRLQICQNLFHKSRPYLGFFLTKPLRIYTKLLVKYFLYATSFSNSIGIKWKNFSQ